MRRVIEFAVTSSSSQSLTKDALDLETYPATSLRSMPLPSEKDTSIWHRNAFMRTGKYARTPLSQSSRVCFRSIVSSDGCHSLVSDRTLHPLSLYECCEFLRKDRSGGGNSVSVTLTSRNIVR